MDNGSVIKYAHPYASSRIPGKPYQDHRDTTAEFFFLALLFSSASLLAALIVIGMLFLWENRFKVAVNLILVKCSMDNPGFLCAALVQLRHDRLVWVLI